MTADDHIIVSAENRLEKESEPEIDRRIAPWRARWLSGRDDFGRDAIVQLTEGSVEGVVLCPEIAAMQAKATRAALGDVASVYVETRHLQNWSADTAPPTLVVLWSKRSQQLRVRTARDALRDVERQSPEWRSQGKVALQFRREHVLEDNVAALESLRRSIVDELDAHGGRTRVHKAKRRLLLSFLYSPRTTMSSVFTLDTKPPDGTPQRGVVTLRAGGGWIHEDVAREDSSAEATIAAAFLLYEQVWLPMNLAGIFAGVVGARRLGQLVESDRVVFVCPHSHLGLAHPVDSVQGQLVAASLGGPKNDEADVWCARVERERRMPGVASVLRRAVRLDSELAATRALEQTLRDLQRADIRAEIGACADTTRFPIWDAELFNRVLHLNVALASAHENSLDVVEHEAALSHVAARKLTSTEFVRQHDNVRGIEEALFANSLPDLGEMVSTLGIDRWLEVTGSAEAQGFRDWYWEFCAPAWNNDPLLAGQFRGRATKVLGIDARTMFFSASLQFAYLAAAGSSLATVSTPVLGGLGYLRRSRDGARTLSRQRAVHEKRRRSHIAHALGVLPGPYEQCPCGSPEKFKFCCGK